MSELAKSHSQEIKERREKVASLLKFKTENQIAEELGCSRETIARDVAHLKRTSQVWLDDLARDGFVFEYKNSLDELKENRLKLRELYNSCTDDVEKRAILKDIDINIERELKLLAEMPTVLAFRKKVGGMT